MTTLEQVHSNTAPQAIGPYSQAIKAGSMVFLSGQIPLNPETMELVSDDVAAQTHQVFKNLIAVAEAAGGGLANTVKLTIYLTDLGDFAVVNEIMAGYFNEPYPARATIQVSALPKGSAVEIDAVLAL
ncbi:RidA family protein [Gammaproteobacteria bacterium]|mgnify:FL=1|jgi:reactive intermediate/imine deaminase|nr:RidA family protein [Gammaproteobacteria bacterium]MBT6482694.1 RidA family protein [Gammaproteobacteria bacterium]MBT7225316.1 RidA family protein [Gammaproteobacteria bacterium]MDB3898345.1 RidA family protein [Gammaproteobacteria bacterium]HAS49314.1 reactive intermediate/imine deaminase [Gammaproteobacteria bacterium]